jgi:hypothetical protein
MIGLSFRKIDAILASLIFFQTSGSVAAKQVCGAGEPSTTRESIGPLGSRARSLDRGWPDYQIIIWQQQTAARLTGLIQLGVSAGKIFGEREEKLGGPQIPPEMAPFLRRGFRPYIENIATDFYSSYHRWNADRPVNWLFEEAKRLYHHMPGDRAAFVRSPSLSDPLWLRRIRLRLQEHVRAYKPCRPLYYSLADEAGIADLSAAWDFDFAPESLASMRVWLRLQYHSLAALNREWETHFPSWDAVMPMTTDEALRQPTENFAAWADFKAWMDVAFARAIRVGTTAVRAADLNARTAIEGAQSPGWGGYNYGQLAAAVDVMEMSDRGNSIEIARSLAPNLVTLTTSSLADQQQVHDVWHQFLLGGRGLILWDPDGALVTDDGTPTPRGRTLEELATELRSGLAAQLIASAPVTDPVAILYSPESQRTQWLLDRKFDEKPWVERGSETEDADDNPGRAVTRRMAKMLTHLGVQPRWLTCAMIEQGELRTNHIRALLLPHAIALSPEAARQIRDFAARGGYVVTDSQPGLFDAHSRRLPKPLLANLTGTFGPIALAPELRQDATSDDPTSLALLRQALERVGVMPHFTLSAPDETIATNIDVRVFRNGSVRIIGLQRDRPVEDTLADQDVVLRFANPVYVHDLGLRLPRTQRTTQVRLSLGPVAPAVIAVSPDPMRALAIEGPEQVRLGAVADFVIIPTGTRAADTRIIHLEAIAPDRTLVRASATNLSTHGKQVVWRLPVALNNPVGNWTIRMVDVLAGRTTERRMVVLPATRLTARRHFRRYRSCCARPR